MTDQFDSWRLERNAALTNLDVAWARSRIEEEGRFDMNDATLLLALHKARYDCAEIAAELRLASGDWLRERGYRRGDGRPLEAPGVLPR